jgi:Cu-processing system ATP-binding protein
MEILRTENLGKRFGEKWVLNDVNLEFYEGEITIISGPNGSGKTTFIKSILGLVVPSKGRIFFKGKDVAGESEYRRYLGYMPQIPKFPENLTPKEIFSLMREIYGKDRMEDPQRYIEEFSLRDFWDKPVGTLSVKAHVYFLDEPNASLDPKSSVVLKEEILRKKSEGASVVIITHIISYFEDIADRLIYFL